MDLAEKTSLKSGKNIEPFFQNIEPFFENVEGFFQKVLRFQKMHKRCFFLAPSLGKLHLFEAVRLST